MGRLVSTVLTIAHTPVLQELLARDPYTFGHCNTYTTPNPMRMQMPALRRGLIRTSQRKMTGKIASRKSQTIEKAVERQLQTKHLG